MTDEPLPAIVPIFPLSGVLLLPRAPLPLHIFEPRYRAMTRDALDGDGFIAMVQPSGAGNDPMNPPVYPVACLGKIITSENGDDGRYNIVLKGQIRLRIAQEVSQKDGYRRVEADYSDFRTDLKPDREEIERPQLLDALRGYLERRNLQANWDDAKKASNEALVNALAAACPFNPQEKQALLEAGTVAERCALMIALCEMDVGNNGPAAIH
jgi:Lon protease-like protein